MAMMTYSMPNEQMRMNETKYAYTQPERKPPFSALIRLPSCRAIVDQLSSVITFAHRSHAAFASSLGVMWRVWAATTSESVTAELVTVLTMLLRVSISGDGY